MNKSCISVLKNIYLRGRLKYNRSDLVVNVNDSEDIQLLGINYNGFDCDVFLHGNNLLTYDRYFNTTWLIIE